VVLVRLSPILCLCAVVAAGSGCHRPKNPWVYAPPPAVALSVYAQPVEPTRTVVAVAEFKNPDAPQLNWPDVGLEMTKAMRRSLFNTGDVEVHIAPEVERIVAQPGFLKGQGVFTEPVEVDFVIIGQVTDFHHTAALPKDASRWGLIGRRHEAVVAIDWKIVDVKARRVVAADHTYGTAKASRKKTIDEMYEGLDASAYLFWNTPLGRAGHEAIDKAIASMYELLPTHVSGLPTIVKVDGPRKLRLQGGWTWGLVEGQEFFLAQRAEGRPPRTIYDADTGLPLVARIGHVRKDASTAWLIGKPPADVDLEGAVLTGEILSPPAGEGDGEDRVNQDTLADIRGSGR
jgi:curli biogenesis system outer membrane secretion channel CsgG